MIAILTIHLHLPACSLAQSLKEKRKQDQCLCCIINSLENEGDKIYRKALGQLFESRIEPIELIREKEILDAMEETIDACEDVMDLIRSVVTKNG